MARRIRITGGDLRGFMLSAGKHGDTRPTTALVREAIFNIVGPGVSGARVVDLFAGTGALGMEALSRGAATAWFVEADAANCRALRENLGRAGLTARAHVIQARLPAALKRLEGPFDLVLLDPPYESPAGERTFLQLGPLLAAKGLVVYEHRSSYNPPERTPYLRQVERRHYGDTAIALYAFQEGQ